MKHDHELEHDGQVRPPRPAVEAPATGLSGPPGVALHLQRAAGNRAVASAMSSSPPVVLQRGIRGFFASIGKKLTGAPKAETKKLDPLAPWWTAEEKKRVVQGTYYDVPDQVELMRKWAVAAGDPVAPKLARFTAIHKQLENIGVEYDAKLHGGLDNEMRDIRNKDFIPAHSRFSAWVREWKATLPKAAPASAAQAPSTAAEPGGAAAHQYGLTPAYGFTPKQTPGGDKTDEVEQTYM